jgi:hypothetical protein
VKTEVNDYIGDAVPEFALDDYIKEADLEKFTAIINEKGHNNKLRGGIS